MRNMLFCARTKSRSESLQWLGHLAQDFRWLGRSVQDVLPGIQAGSVWRTAWRYAAPNIAGFAFAILLFAVLSIAPVAALAQPVEVDAAQPFFPEGRPLEGLIITLDPGHGGSAHQPGYSGSARGVNSGVVEGDLNMLVAGHLRHHLVNAGAKVYMTRWDDRKVTPGDSQRAEELGARTRVAVESRSHLFLSLHHNWAQRRSADGVMILIWPTDSAGKISRSNANLRKSFARKSKNASTTKSDSIPGSIIILWCLDATFRRRASNLGSSRIRNSTPG